MEEGIVRPEQTSKIVYFKSCLEELSEYNDRKEKHSGQLIPLDSRQDELRVILKAANIELPLEEKIDVYNPSIPFYFQGIEYIAGRVEPTGKEGEYDSMTIFFKRESQDWIPLPKPVFKLQDPNITWVNGIMFLSGVELAPLSEEETLKIKAELPPGEEMGTIKWRTVFYSGKDFKHLERALEGPWGMKGIRITNLTDGKIGVYTRPQGGEAQKGQIGFTIMDSIDDLTNQAKFEEAVNNAPLFDYRFPEGEWGGVNQVIPQPDGRNLLIGHRAYQDEQKGRHYFPWACLHDPLTGEVIDLGILSKRSNHNKGPIKADDLGDVKYTSGIFKKGDEWFLVSGLSDTQAGIEKINDPLDRLL